MDPGDDTDLQSYEDEQVVVRMTEVAAAERQQQVQMMLNKQMDTGGSLEEQLQQRKSFTKGSAVKSISDHTQGQLSLRDFVCIQEENQTVDDLRDCGLTDQEIAFKLHQEGKTSSIIRPAKRGNLAVDPSAQSKRLKEVNTIISQQQQEDQPGSSRQDANPPPQPRKGIFSQLSLSRKFTHPDDPINHLQVLEAEVLQKLSSADKDHPVVYQGCDPKPPDYESQDEGISDNVPGDERSLAGISTDKSQQLELRAERSNNIAQIASKSLDDVQVRDKYGINEQKIYSSNDQNTADTCGNAAESSTDSRGKSGESCQCSPDPECTEINSSRKRPSECKERSHEINLAQSNPIPARRQLQGQVIAISDEDIKSRRLSVDEICQLDRFKNYTAGIPSKVLYLKNLTKHVTEEDLVSLFIRFQFSDKEKLVFKLLRCQAFVTFPDIETATSALNLVNGYELKGKPIIIQYGKQGR
ncbi:RNA-binding protein 41-like isoform X2 [Amphiura filiformis]|uniref:RNA-binding protein 41-like isoform X2 n=1 Tax=Amphiura filiformis TaxID=82378 RepID=UPI003B210200